MKYKIWSDPAFWHIDLLENGEQTGGILIPKNVSKEDVEEIAKNYVELQDERHSDNPS